MDALTFAAAMERSIIDNMARLRIGCSPELSRVLDFLLEFHGEFERMMRRTKMLKEGKTWPELTSVTFVGSDETWRDLTGSINPGTPPLVSDYTTLWCIHALLDK